MTFELKSMKYNSLKGMSEGLLKDHHDVLYAGYVKKFKEITDALKNVDLTKANATYSELGELKREETFALNGVILHEAYFDNLGGDGEAKGEIKRAIESEFGNYEKFVEYFKACGLAARGWVILSLSLHDGKLYLFSQDLHNDGVVWGFIPVMIMDVYEHAYMRDYSVKRKEYIEAFFNNLDWDDINNKYKKAIAAYKAMN